MSFSGNTGSHPYAINAQIITTTAFRAVDNTHIVLDNTILIFGDILVQTDWHLVAEDMSSGVSNQELFFIDYKVSEKYHRAKLNQIS